MALSTITTNASDALLAIRNGYTTARWNFPDAVGTPEASPGGIGHAVALTYSFASLAPAYYSGDFAAFDEVRKGAARSVLASIGESIGVSFSEVASGGQIAFALSSQPPGQGGYAYSPAYSYSYYPGGNIVAVSEQASGGDVWLNRNASGAAADWQPGSGGYVALLHEIGHALGLKHPFEAPADGYFLDPALDDVSHTVMSYTEAPNSRLITVSGTAASYAWQESFLQPSTLMPLDIAALQYLYGANTTTRTGNDVYQWASNAEILQTLWDAGGTDAIDASNQIFTCLIDLTPGNYSSIGYRQTDAELRQGLDLPSWFTQPLPGDTYNAYHNLAIANGCWLENAYGGSAADHLIGNDLANLLKGNGGNDQIEGGAGNDTLDGGSGADTMAGGDGNDTYYVRDAGDVVSELAGVTAGSADLAYSYVAAYTLADNLERGRIMSSGTASLTGNALDNLLYAAVGNNVLSGGAGSDTVTYAYGVGGTTGVTVSLASAAAQATGGSGSDTLTAIEHLIGSAYADRLTGDAGANRLEGAAGNDTLDGASGVDTMVGGDGDDVFHVRDVGDLVSESSAASGGYDQVYSYLAAYTLTGYVEVGHIALSAAANLTGNALDNLLFAGLGDNVLSGGSGNDTVTYAEGSSGGVTVSLATSAVQPTGGSGNDTLSSIENLIGSAYADKLTGNANANRLEGGAGNDTLDGGLGSDTMAGGDGDDIYYVRDAGDVVSELAGASAGSADLVYSYAATCTLGDNVERGRIIASGAANLNGNALNNLLYAAAGDNVINGAAGTDTLSYAYGVSGTNGVTVSLAVSTAQATGGSGSDTLTGIENLIGSAYADRLSGNGGNNVLTGGNGQDTLSGGGGNDLFDFNALTESGVTATTWDVITDFATGDRIDLATLDANTATAANDAFGGTLVASFTAAGQLRFDAASHVLYGNTDADSDAEFAIQLLGVNGLVAADLVL